MDKKKGLNQQSRKDTKEQDIVTKKDVIANWKRNPYSKLENLYWYKQNECILPSMSAKNH